MSKKWRLKGVGHDVGVTTFEDMSSEKQLEAVEDSVSKTLKLVRAAMKRAVVCTHFGLEETREGNVSEVEC